MAAKSKQNKFPKEIFVIADANIGTLSAYADAEDAASFMVDGDTVALYTLNGTGKISVKFNKGAK